MFKEKRIIFELNSPSTGTESPTTSRPEVKLEKVDLSVEKKSKLKQEFEYNKALGSEVINGLKGKLEVHLSRKPHKDAYYEERLVPLNKKRFPEDEQFFKTVQRYRLTEYNHDLKKWQEKKEKQVLLINGISGFSEKINKELAKDDWSKLSVQSDLSSLSLFVDVAGRFLDGKSVGEEEWAGLKAISEIAGKVEKKKEVTPIEEVEKIENAQTAEPLENTEKPEKETEPSSEIAISDTETAALETPSPEQTPPVTEPIDDPAVKGTEESSEAAPDMPQVDKEKKEEPKAEEEVAEIVSTETPKEKAQNTEETKDKKTTQAPKDDKEEEVSESVATTDKREAVELTESLSKNFVFENGKIFVKHNGNKLENFYFPMTEGYTVQKIEEGPSGSLVYYLNDLSKPLQLNSFSENDDFKIQVKTEGKIVFQSKIDQEGNGFFQGDGLGIIENLKPEYLAGKMTALNNQTQIVLNKTISLTQNGVFHGDTPIIQSEILYYKKIDNNSAYILLKSDEPSVDDLRKIQINDDKVSISSFNIPTIDIPLSVDSKEKEFTKDFPVVNKKVKLNGNTILFADKIPLLDGLSGATYRETEDQKIEIKKSDEKIITLDLSEEVADFYPTAIKVDGNLLCNVTEFGFSVPSDKAVQKHYWNFQVVEKEDWEKNYNKMLTDIRTLNSSGGVSFNPRTMEFKKEGVSMDVQDMLKSGGDFDFTDTAEIFRDAFAEADMNKVFQLAEELLVQKGIDTKISRLSNWGITKDGEKITVNGEEINLSKIGAEKFWYDYINKVDSLSGTQAYAEELFINMLEAENRKVDTLKKIDETTGVKENGNELNFSVDSVKIEEIRDQIFQNMDETLLERAKLNFDSFIAKSLQEKINGIASEIKGNFLKDTEGKSAEEISRMATEIIEKAKKETSYESLKTFIEGLPDYNKISENTLVNELFEEEKEYAKNFYDEDPNMRPDDRYGTSIQEYSKYGLVRKIAQKELLDLVFSLGGATKTNIPDLGLLPRLLKYAEDNTKIFSYISSSSEEINKLLSQEQSLENLKKLSSLIREQETEIEKRLKEAKDKIKIAYDSKDDSLGIDSQNVRQRIIFYDDLKTIENSYHGKLKVNSRYSENNYKSMGMEIKVDNKSLSPNDLNKVFNKEKQLINSGKPKGERTKEIITILNLGEKKIEFS